MKKEAIESTLWKNATKLRGSVEWGEYKHIILSLLFLKFTNDNFIKHREILIKDNKEKYLDNIDFYTKDNIVYLPESARWNYLIENASTADISQKIDNALASIEKNNPTLSGALPSDNFVRLQIPQSKVKQLLDSINNIDDDFEDFDIIGLVYEYFLSKFSEAEGKEGQYFTPKHTIKLMNELLKPDKGIVYDPCCGTGGMFVQTYEYLKENEINTKDISFYGQESVLTNYKLARMNLSIRGINNDLGNTSADTFFKDQHKDLKTDYIFANPPFNQSGWRSENELIDDIRWKGYKPPLPGNANYGWILHMIHKMKNQSEAAFLLANGALEDDDSLEIRKQIINNDIVEAIITLPRNMFYSTDASVTLWILNKDKKGKTVTKNNEIYKYKNRVNEILFLDLRKAGKKIGKKIVMTDIDIQNAVTTFYDWRIGNFKAKEEYSKNTSLSEIKENNYSLVPSRYIDFIDKDLDVDFDSEIKKLQKSFAIDIEIQENAISDIKKTMKDLGYEI